MALMLFQLARSRGHRINSLNDVVIKHHEGGGLTKVGHLLKGHVERMRKIKNAHNIFVEKPVGKRTCRDLGVDWRIILKLLLYE
jgi:hypothetical protein